MNSVQLIGRLTKDPEVRVTSGGMSVATFTVAIDRPVKQGAEKQTDFPRVTVFGKQAEICERYLSKGSRVAIEGRIQTGSYQGKDGKTIYTTDVIGNRVEFLETRQREDYGAPQQSPDNGSFQGRRYPENNPECQQRWTPNGMTEDPTPKQEFPESFETINEEVPF